MWCWTLRGCSSRWKQVGIEKQAQFSQLSKGPQTRSTRWRFFDHRTTRSTLCKCGKKNTNTWPRWVDEHIQTWHCSSVSVWTETKGTQVQKTEIILELASSSDEWNKRRKAPSNQRGCSSGVERSLRMRDVLGSIPSISTSFFSSPIIAILWSDLALASFPLIINAVTQSCSSTVPWVPCTIGLIRPG